MYNTISTEQVGTKLSSTSKIHVAWFSDWLAKTRRRTVDGYVSVFENAFLENVICDLDPWTNDPENLIIRGPTIKKYLCKLSFGSNIFSGSEAIAFTRFLWSSLAGFDSMVIASWLWL